MKIKRKLALVLAFMLLAVNTVMMQSAFAEDATYTLGVTATPSTVQMDGTVTFTITPVGSFNLASYMGRINYSASELQYVADSLRMVSAPTGWSVTPIVETGTIGFMVMGSDDQSSGIAIQVSFKVLSGASGTAQISVTDNEGTNNAMTDDYTAIDATGSVSIGSGSGSSTYAVSFASNPVAGGTAVLDDTQSGPYAPGTIIDIKATANTGYKFTSWTLTSGQGTIGNASGASTSFTVGASAATLTANFTAQPTYTASVSPTSKNWSTNVGYSPQAAQQFTITKTGNQDLSGLTATLVDSTNFEISTSLSSTAVTATAATVSVKPKDGLAANTYSTNLIINWNNAASPLTIPLTFNVTTVGTPSAPQNFTATAGNGQVVLNWAAPLSNGGAAIDKYEVSKDGGTSWVTATSNAGHTFAGLTNGTSYTFMVRAVNTAGGGAAATTTATPTSGGGGTGGTGGTGGGTTTTPPTTQTTDNTGTTTVTTAVTTTTTDGVVKATVTSDLVSTMIAEAGKATSAETVVLDFAVTVPNNAKAADVTIPIQSMAVEGKDVVLDIDFGHLGSVSIGTEALAGLTEAGNTMNLVISDGKEQVTDEALLEKIGNNPVVDVKLTINNVPVTNFLGAVIIAVPMPDGFDPLTSVIWYIDNDGNPSPVNPCWVKDGKIFFETAHFSTFAVVNNKVEFTDVPTSHAFYNAITFIAARGITDGFGSTEIFAPTASMDRAMFVTMLCRAFGLGELDGPSEFKDVVAGAYYDGYVNQAAALGITNGAGNGNFEPLTKITEAQMYTMLYRALDVLNKLPDASGKATLNSIPGGADVKEWYAEACVYLYNAGLYKSISAAEEALRQEMANCFYWVLGEN